MRDSPHPPLLYIRPGHAFWTETEWRRTRQAVLQAVTEGCYEGTWILDSDGVRWPILSASFLRRPTWLDRLMSWRALPIELTLGAPVSETVPAALQAIENVLASPGFDFQGSGTLEQFEAELVAAETPLALIQIAHQATRR